jgi:catechol 2,3-dioxygenase-like lactoylglutathione lyase family enzyme
LTSFSVEALDHVAVSAPHHLERNVLAWYSGTLGLEQLPKPEGTRSAGGWFRVGCSEVHVVIEPRRPERPGHFGLVVDDFQKAVDDLRRAGCEIEDARTIPGRLRCYTRDPAGNTVEIVCYDASTSA